MNPSVLRAHLPRPRLEEGKLRERKYGDCEGKADVGKDRESEREKQR